MRRILKRHPRLLVATLTAVATAGVAVAQQATVVGTLEGHTDPVYAIAWSPDGKTLATAGFDNTVRLWDAATRKEIKKYEGHSKLVLAVAIAPDGKHILSGSQDNTAKIWDYPTSGPVKTFAGHPAAIEALAIKPDGKQFAAAAGKSVKVWDLNSGTVIKDLEGHAGDVSSVAWRGDGGQLATGDKANTIRLWKATSPRTRPSNARPRLSWDWAIFPIISSLFRRDRTGWLGSGNSRSPRRGGLRPRDRSRPSRSAATPPSSPPREPIRSSASGTRPMAS